MNIGIILAAGNSTRFNDETPKQLYLIDDKPVINHSIDILSECLDEIIIVTNTYCSDKIKTKHTIIINYIDDIIESIKAALDYIGDKKYIIAKELLVLQDDESMSDLWGHNKKSVEIYKNAYKKWMI